MDNSELAREEIDFAESMRNAPPGFRPSKSAPTSPAKPLGVSRTRFESFHALHKVPVGDTPYVRAKNVQLVEKDVDRVIPLLWAAINARDRVDSALKDMAIVMKQQNGAEEAIEAIKSGFQWEAHQDNAVSGKEISGLCGARSNSVAGKLGLALMEQNNYIEAEDAYRRALSIATAYRLQTITRCVIWMLNDLESKMMNKGGDWIEQRRLFDAFLGSSSVWQPQPCKDPTSLPTITNAVKAHDDFVDENINSNIMTKPVVNDRVGNQLHETLKRTRSGNSTNSIEIKTRKLSTSEEKGDQLADLLPDTDDFEEAIIAAILSPTNEPGMIGFGTRSTPRMFPKKIDKKLKVFQDITLSPRA
ncbi:hypothetical protein DITRI_Ditri09bG0116700 [Diplodiscus trichospermus]